MAYLPCGEKTTKSKLTYLHELWSHNERKNLEISEKYSKFVGKIWCDLTRRIFSIFWFVGFQKSAKIPWPQKLRVSKIGRAHATKIFSTWSNFSMWYFQKKIFWKPTTENFFSNFKTINFWPNIGLKNSLFFNILFFLFIISLFLA